MMPEPTTLSLVSAVADIGAFGLIAWLFVILVRQSVPSVLKHLDEMQAAYSSELENLRKCFASELRQQRHDFRDELQAARIAHSKQTLSLISVLAQASEGATMSEIVAGLKEALMVDGISKLNRPTNTERQETNTR